MNDPTLGPADAVALLIGNRDSLMRPLRDWLETSGYSVVTAASGQEATACIRKGSPHLIVADAVLTDPDPVELCQLVRADAHTIPGAPILVVSREEIPRERRLAILRAGAWECLTCPWDPDAVLLRIRSYVQGRMDVERARSDGLMDPGTGLYNARGLARRAREMGSQAFRGHEPLACVMISIELMPEAGAVPASAVWTPVATALQATVRPSDPKGRVSATEFAIFAAGTDEAGAKQMTARVRRAVQQAIDVAGLRPEAYRVNAAYEAVANLTYAPVEPTEMMSRASTSLRGTRSPRATGPRRLASD